MQLHHARLRVKAIRTFFDLPAAVASAVGASKHVAAKRRLVLPGHRGRHLLLEAHLLDVLEVIQAVDVDPAAAVIILRRQLPLAVLILQALEVVHHGAGIAVLGAQEMVLPAAPFAGAAHAAEEPSVHLREDVRRVQGLQTSGLHATPAALLHLVQDEDVIGEAELPRRHRLEEPGELALALHVDERLVLCLPEERREGLPLQHEAQAQPLHRVLAAANARPPAEVINKMEKLKVLAVADHRAEHLAHEAPLDAVPLSGRVRIRIFVERGAVAALALKPSDVGGSLQRLHLGAPVQGRPKRTLEAHLLEELERAAALVRISIRVPWGTSCAS